MGTKFAGYFAVFAMGLLVGSMASWNYAKKKYEQIAQEEINSVKEAFGKHTEKSRMKETSQVVNRPDVTEYNCLVKEYSGDILDKDRPYVIPPDEFGELDDYAKISLTYYSDGVVADENDEIVDDVEDMIGFDSLSHFGEYEDDSVFVRSDKRRCDYEILRDYESYSQVLKRKPH